MSPDNQQQGELPVTEQFPLLKQVLLELDVNSSDYKKSLFQETSAFLDYYIDYTTSILNGKGYSDKKIAEVILKEEFNSMAEEKDALLKYLMLSKDYLAYLKRVITEVNIERYIDKLLVLIPELDWLSIQYELHLAKSDSGFQPGRLKTDTSSPSDFLISLNNLFYTEDLDTLDHLYLGDVTPAIMVQIRQLFAGYGMKIIGCLEITDKEGRTVKEFTQVIWNYICEDVNRPSSRISLPFDLQTYLTINSWASRFSNTTYLYSSYIQFWALKQMEMLFATGSMAERQKHKKYLLADIKIRDYDAFKLDFEHYLAAQLPDARVKWDNIKNVGVLITNR